MGRINCVAYFDLLGEVWEEKEMCEQCWKVWSSGHPGIADRVRWVLTDDPKVLYDRIPGADFVFFDYGGLVMPGHESAGLSFARELEKQVVERPSVEFILLCTMGTHWYRDHYTDEHPNLHFEDTLWSDLFDRYLGEKVKNAVH
jgi:hypothetical protein